MSETPYMDEQCEGPWPSHAAELKKTRFPVMRYEISMKGKYTQWGHGGMSHVPGLGPGAIARKSRRPDIVTPSNLIRVLGNPGNFYETPTFRKICELADRYGDGSLHVLTTNSNIEICGLMTNENVEKVPNG